LPKPKLIEALRAEGTSVASGAPGGSNHLSAIFQEQNHPAFSRPEIQHKITYRKGDLPRSEKPRQDMMTIPAFPAADKILLDQYIEAFHKVTDNAVELLKKI